MSGREENGCHKRDSKFVHQKWNKRLGPLPVQISPLPQRALVGCCHNGVLDGAMQAVSYVGTQRKTLVQNGNMVGTQECTNMTTVGAATVLLGKQVVESMSKAENSSVGLYTSAF